MKQHTLRYLQRNTLVRRLCSSALIVLITLLVPGLLVNAQGNDSAQITSPQANDSLFGLVNVLGSASNPNLQRYTLEFDSQDTDTEQWFPIAGPITQQVNNGVLGQWNTTAVPDGRYQVRLRVVLRDGTVLDAIVQNLHVSNKQPTPLPSPQPSQTPLQATIPPTIGPSPTPIIQQPPTSTARPIIPTVMATLGVSGSTPQSEGTGVSLAFDSIGNAFCNGAYIAIGAFFFIGMYSVLHKRLRPMVRRLLGQVRDDVRG